MVFASFMFYFGWIVGSRVTTHQIAQAVLSGKLSTHQRLEKIADQIESGLYVNINGEIEP